MMISEQVVARDVAIDVGERIPRFKSVDDSGAEFDSRSLNGHLCLLNSSGRIGDPTASASYVEWKS